MLIHPASSNAAARRFTAKSCQRGFTLVELMVALVVTLIVTLAAVSFIASIARASSDNIRVTRLTQELRAVSEVVSREIRRARYVTDPIGLVGLGGAATGNDSMGVLPSAATGLCFFYQYNEPPPSGTLIRRSVYLDETAGRMFLAPDSSCAGGNPITSPEVIIARCRRPDASLIPVFALNSAFEVRQEICGRLRGGNTATQAVSRQFTQSTFIRSGQVK